MYNYFLEEIEKIYQKARRQAVRKSELSAGLFPESCPFSANELLNPEFFPD
ncbi:DUF29 family protein [Synechocystis sp. PCC 7338]|uniref:DUF29 family protein n=1 Tax=Synechocystis sp. PCC 7338 TaxID=2732530 RepID=UPI0021041CE2|nr:MULTISPECIES: DUF29 family protein [unclassified Synechocystis]